jgi:hypothetical protein
MAIVWFDPINYATADLGKTYSAITAYSTVEAGQGYKGSNAISGTTVSSNGVAVGGLPASATYCTAFYFKRFITASSNAPLVIFYNGVNTEVTIAYNQGTGTLTASRGSATAIAVGTVPLSYGAHDLVEIEVTISDTVGVVKVNINGTPSINFSGDTKASTAGVPANISAIEFVHYSSSTTKTYLSHPIIYNKTGAAPTAFSGQHRISILTANANGTYSGLTNESGNSTNLYQSIDDSAPDGTTYIQGTTANTKATFGFSDLTGTPTTIYCLGMFPLLQTDDGGTKTFANMQVTGGTDYVQATQTVPAGQLYKPTIISTNPATSAAYTAANVNAIEAGVKIIS